MGLEGGARRGEVLVNVGGRRGGTRRRGRRGTAWKGPGTIDVYVNINTNDTCHLIVISHIIGILPSRSPPLPPSIR